MRIMTFFISVSITPRSSKNYYSRKSNIRTSTFKITIDDFDGINLDENTDQRIDSSNQQNDEENGGITRDITRSPLKEITVPVQQKYLEELTSRGAYIYFKRNL